MYRLLRGITFCSLAGKVYAKCREIVESIVEDGQFGFCPGRSTTDIGTAKIFDWDVEQITCNNVIRNFRKRSFLGDKDIVE